MLLAASPGRRADRALQLELRIRLGAHQVCHSTPVPAAFCSWPTRCRSGFVPGLERDVDQVRAGAAGVLLHLVALALVGRADRVQLLGLEPD